MTEEPATRDEQFRDVLERVVAENAEILRRLALGPGAKDVVLLEALEAVVEYVSIQLEAADAAALLERAKAAAYATPEAEWVTYTEGDLEALRRQDTVADAAVDEDFFEEDEPIGDVLAAREAGDRFVTEEPPHNAGWCAPSP
jgi:hypothetical protein